MAPGHFRLFAGLGNPGGKYSKSRHNVGFMAIDRFAKDKGISFQEKTKIYGSLANLKTEQQSIKLIKPNTFMNESGLCIRSTLNWFDLNISELVVLVDDMDLPLGRIRIRSQGSSGGHNGLKSTINHLGTTEFCRIRIGIGAPSIIKEERKAKTNSHVLGDFSTNEKLLLNNVLNELVNYLKLINSEDFEKICTRINSFRANEEKII